MKRLQFLEATLKLQTIVRWMEYRAFDYDNEIDLDALLNKINHVYVLIDNARKEQLGDRVDMD